MHAGFAGAIVSVTPVLYLRADLSTERAHRRSWFRLAMTGFPTISTTLRVHVDDDGAPDVNFPACWAEGFVRAGQVVRPWRRRRGAWKLRSAASLEWLCRREPRTTRRERSWSVYRDGEGASPVCAIDRISDRDRRSSAVVACDQAASPAARNAPKA